MPATKTNERPGTRAQHRYARLSATKARVVLDLIRGKTVAEADEVLAFVERDAAAVIRKVLDSAVANAEHNDEVPADELYVSACYADEGPTLKRWRPRARGRATRIRKRTCHITVIVSRLAPEELDRIRRAEEAARAARTGGGGRRTARDAAEARRRRVAKSRQAQADHDTDEPPADETGEPPADETAEATTNEASAEAEGAVDTTEPVADEVVEEAEAAAGAAEPEVEEATDEATDDTADTDTETKD
jgi:large subunit ribosomal protein L22